MDSDSRPFLKHFSPNERGWIYNLFLDARRKAGSPHAGAAVTWVEMEVDEQVFQAVQHNDARLPKLRDLALALDGYRDEALELAQQAIDYCDLPDAERRAHKEYSANEAKQAWMETQPASPKQVAFLRRLGYDGVVNNKAHASELIDARMAKAGRR